MNWFGRLSTSARVGICIAIGLLVAAICWYRLSRTTAESDPVAYYQALAQREFASMRGVAWSDWDEIQRLIVESPAEDPDGLFSGRSDKIDLLRSEVMAFLRARFLSDGPEDYVASMASLGYVWKDREDLEQRYGSLEDLARIGGVATTEPVRVMSALWSRQAADGRALVECCIDPASLVITIGTANHNRPMSHLAAGRLGEEVWHGGSSMGCRLWFKPPVSRDELVAREGLVPAALVGLVVSTRSGPRRPLMLSLFYDGGSNRWWLDGVNVNNFIAPDGVRPCSEY